MVPTSKWNVICPGEMEISPWKPKAIWTKTTFFLPSLQKISLGPALYRTYRRLVCTSAHKDYISLPCKTMSERVSEWERGRNDWGIKRLKMCPFIVLSPLPILPLLLKGFFLCRNVSLTTFPSTDFHCPSGSCSHFTTDSYPSRAQIICIPNEIIEWTSPELKIKDNP